MAYSRLTMPHILIIDSRFYENIADELVAGAVQVLKRRKATYDRISVPGAFEIPASISFAIKSGGFDGYIALGCVIRGETTHYDYVCQESARGLNQLAIKHNAAIGYGILTVENEGQAWERALISKGNKGGVAAGTCLKMVALRKHFGL